jgi:2,3-bisphosphoglycerate-dependent phosphoglycerate mutase
MTRDHHYDIPLFAQPFHFMRHGESESNRANTIAGLRDVPLTELGRKQARAAVDAVRALGITAVYTSTLQRARETAEPIARDLNLPLTVIAELRERNWGELEGKPRSPQTRAATPPGAETPQEFERRVLRGLSRIDPGGKPLLVAHSGVLRVLYRTLGISEPEAPIANALPVQFVPPDSTHASWRIEIWRNHVA